RRRTAATGSFRIWERSTATATARCRRWRPKLAAQAASCATSDRLRRLGGLRVALHHFVLEHAPDLAMQRLEFLVQPHLEDAARTGELHAPVADDARGRPRRHDHDAVGERNRLLEIMGDEQHGLAVGIPEVE